MSCEISNRKICLTAYIHLDLRHQPWLLCAGPVVWSVLVVQNGAWLPCNSTGIKINFSHPQSHWGIASVLGVSWYLSDLYCFPLGSRTPRPVSRRWLICRSLCTVLGWPSWADISKWHGWVLTSGHWRASPATVVVYCLWVFESFL